MKRAKSTESILKALRARDVQLTVDIFIELVTLLSHKNIMNDSEGMALLRKLSK